MSDFDTTSIAFNTRRLALGQGLSMVDLAQKSGLNTQTLYRGGASLRTLKPVAEALGVSIADLMDTEYLDAARKFGADNIRKNIAEAERHLATMTFVARYLEDEAAARDAVAA